MKRVFLNYFRFHCNLFLKTVSLLTCFFVLTACSYEKTPQEEKKKINFETSILTKSCNKCGLSQNVLFESRDGIIDFVLWESVINFDQLEKEKRKDEYLSDCEDKEKDFKFVGSADHSFEIDKKTGEIRRKIRIHADKDTIKKLSEKDLIGLSINKDGVLPLKENLDKLLKNDWKEVPTVSFKYKEKEKTSKITFGLKEDVPFRFFQANYIDGTSFSLADKNNIGMAAVNREHTLEKIPEVDFYYTIIDESVLVSFTTFSMDKETLKAVSSSGAFPSMLEIKNETKEISIEDLRKHYKSLGWEEMTIQEDGKKIIRNKEI